MTNTKPTEPFEFFTFLIKEQTSIMEVAKKDGYFDEKAEAYHTGKLTAYKEALGVILGDDEIILNLRKRKNKIK